MIDLAKGNPDAFPAHFIREVAKKAVDDPGNARYSPFDGKPSFLRAAESWYRNSYGVEVDWKTQLFAVEGAGLMVWLRCSPCSFLRAMLWHMRIRITLRTIA